jgi:O-acetyl-ADP-ribose deacetylase (regulator of RNase III)
MNQVIWEKEHKQIWIRIVKGDLTAETVDAIVNAANSHLLHGGGVAAAIVLKGGLSIQIESLKVAPVLTGNCAITSAGKLPCKYVIHAVGPVWGEGNEDAKLASAVLNSLKKADLLKLSSISIPAISSGIYGFPKDRCASVFRKIIEEYVNSDEVNCLHEIRICLINKEMVDIFVKEFSLMSN